VKKKPTSAPRPSSRQASKAAAKPKIRVRSLEKTDWPVIEELFGEKGACGGCWCMTWRVPSGGKLWQESKGEPNRRAFKKLVTGGKVYGCLAFAGDEPVGWCCVGPKTDFPRLMRSRVLKTDATEGTWAITCFYIRSGWRSYGVASAMLPEAVRVAKANGAKSVEGYPVKPYSEKPIPAAFAWTGVPVLFEREEFVVISLPGSARNVYRKDFTRRKVSNR